MKLARAAEMQAMDRAAIERYSIPGIVLMENAGRGTVDFLCRQLGRPAGKVAPIFIGPGNNGGDGLVIARHIHQLGGLPFLVYLVRPELLRGDAAVNGAIVRKIGIPFQIIEKDEDLQAAVDRIAGFGGTSVWSIIDALFGTGLTRNVEGTFLAATECINSLGQRFSCPVTAVDIPSGLNSDTGQVLGACVRADFTVAYGLAKPAHFMHGGGPIGRLHVADISLPAAVADAAGLRGEALDEDILHHLDQRGSASHKGSYGHLLILAGSGGKTGAAILCGLGAMRIGTGLVTLCVPHDLDAIFAASLFEAMTIPLSNSHTCLSMDDYETISHHLQGKSALAIGPGLGIAPETRELVVRLYREAELPMVVDADALNILARHPGHLADPPSPRILTPHPGEMARLTGTTGAAVQADRLRAALDFTKVLNVKTAMVTLVLKGAGTVICSPDSSWAINTSGNPGMAAGGMGDVLTGIISGLLAQGMQAEPAARLGVYLHGRAADRIAGQRPFGYLASEVAEAIPYLLGAPSAAARQI